MNIGIIGAGEMGTCLASKFVNLGHTVVIANSRGPSSLQQVTADTGAEAVTVSDATKNKNVIIVSIPQKNIPQLPKTLFTNLPEDVVVIDTGNYYPTLRDGAIAELDQNGIGSCWVQAQLGVPVIKVFNSILATSIQNLGKPKADKDRVAMAVSGDNQHGKETVFLLVEALGFDAYDLGTIAHSWKQQPGSTIYCRDIPLNELKKRVTAMGTDWSVMRNTILSKRKTVEALMRADYPAYLEGLHDQA